jgi:hypothetical protein
MRVFVSGIRPALYHLRRCYHELGVGAARTGVRYQLVYLLTSEDRPPKLL